MENIELEAVVEMLNGAKVVGFDNSGEEDVIIDLTPECVLSAMDYLKANPQATIQEACNFGLNEWIK